MITFFKDIVFLPSVQEDKILYSSLISNREVEGLIYCYYYY
jgi:hypothetical protein